MTDNEKIKALREICGCSIADAKKAILYCKNYENCNEIGYIYSKNCAVYTKCSPEERISNFSHYVENTTCYLRWKQFLNQEKI